MLEKSGIVWGRGTVQYRFLFRHYSTLYAKQYRSNVWYGNRLLDVLTALFVPYMDTMQRENYFNKSFGALTEVLDLDNPYAAAKDTTPVATDEDKEKYIRAFDNKGYKNISDIVKAMENINQKVIK